MYPAEDERCKVLAASSQAAGYWQALRDFGRGGTWAGGTWTHTWRQGAREGVARGYGNQESPENLGRSGPEMGKGNPTDRS